MPAQESIYVRDTPQGAMYARRMAARPKHLRWVLQLPSGHQTRYRSLSAIQKKYPGKWRKAAGRGARKARKNPSEPFTLYANPYDITAKGWYFHDADDFDRKFKAHLPVEEYEIDWIDGPEEDRELFEALDVSQSNVDSFFELIDELSDHDKAALYYLLRYRGMGPGEDLDELLEKVDREVRVREGNSKEYVEDYIDDAGGVGQAFSKDVIAGYFDYDRFGRDMAYDLDPDDPSSAYYLEMDPGERAEEYIDNIGGLSALGKQAEDYFDVDAFARDMELNSEIAEFDFAGSTYTTDYMG